MVLTGEGELEGRGVLGEGNELEAWRVRVVASRWRFEGVRGGRSRGRRDFRRWKRGIEHLSERRHRVSRARRTKSQEHSLIRPRPLSIHQVSSRGCRQLRSNSFERSGGGTPRGTGQLARFGFSSDGPGSAGASGSVGGERGLARRDNNDGRWELEVSQLERPKLRREIDRPRDSQLPLNDSITDFPISRLLLLPASPRHADNDKQYLLGWCPLCPCGVRLQRLVTQRERVRPLISEAPSFLSWIEPV